MEWLTWGTALLVSFVVSVYFLPADRGGIYKPLSDQRVTVNDKIWIIAGCILIACVVGILGTVIFDGDSAKHAGLVSSFITYGWHTGKWDKWELHW